MMIPRPLKKKDKVAIVSLSSGVLGEAFCKHQLELGIKRLKQMGLDVVVMPNALKGIDYLNKHPEKRAEDLKNAFLDPSIHMILSAIGGNDTYRLLPYLMEDSKFLASVEKNPKLFLGFSDSTHNHMMFYKLGLRSYYGLSFLSDVAELDLEMLPYSYNAFMQLFENKKPLYLESSPIWYEERCDFSEASLNKPRIKHIESYGYQTFGETKQVEGILFGGCLESIYDIITDSKIASLYEKYALFPKREDLSEMVLFLETSEEKPTSEVFKEMLDALIEADILPHVKALLVGKPQDEAYYEAYYSILQNVSMRLSLPILYNINVGHALPRAVLAYGSLVSIDFENKMIKMKNGLFE